MIAAKTPSGMRQRFPQGAARLASHLTSCMSIFKGLFPPNRGAKGVAQEYGYAQGPETTPVKMNLEERMAFRRELLFENVRSTLEDHSIETKTYHFKVMRTDKRGHCYVIMLDMSPRFMASEMGQHARLADIAAALTRNAQTRYGLIVGGVYWRIDETLATQMTGSAKAPAQPVFSNSQPGTELTNIEKYERATAEELAAFEAAWQRDRDIQLGDRTYSSDLAPLSEDPPLR